MKYMICILLSYLKLLISPLKRLKVSRSSLLVNCSLRKSYQ